MIVRCTANEETDSISFSKLSLRNISFEGYFVRIVTSSRGNVFEVSVQFPLLTRGGTKMIGRSVAPSLK